MGSLWDELDENIVEHRRVTSTWAYVSTEWLGELRDLFWKSVEMV